MPEPLTIHGTAVAVAGRAVLIRGSSGAGKSDLALRMLAVPAGPFAAEAPLLVADDRVIASAGAEAEAGAGAEAAAGAGGAAGARVIVSAPAVLRGLIEVRGVGIVRVPAIEAAELVLVADLVAEPGAIERLPGPIVPATIEGATVPRVLVWPFEASAPLKLLVALARAGRSDPTSAA